jgi:hypothetical protein
VQAAQLSQTDLDQDGQFFPGNRRVANKKRGKFEDERAAIHAPRHFGTRITLRPTLFGQTFGGKIGEGKCQ